MTALEDLAGHDERLAVVQQRARALGRDLAEHNAKIGELKQQKIDAHSREDEQLAAKIRKQIDVAEHKVTDLEERQAGAQLTASRADSERTQWIGANYPASLRELEPEAREAARAIDRLADELLAAVKRWEDIRSRVSALAHTGGQTAHVPGLGWDELTQALRHRPRPTRAPVPGEFGVPSVVEHDDPDPTVRERARSEIKEKAAGGGRE